MYTVHCTPHQHLKIWHGRKLAWLPTNCAEWLDAVQTARRCWSQLQPWSTWMGKIQVAKYVCCVCRYLLEITYDNYICIDVSHMSVIYINIICVWRRYTTLLIDDQQIPPMNGNLHRNHGDFTVFSLIHLVMLPSHHPQCQDAMTKVKTSLGSDLYTLKDDLHAMLHGYHDHICPNVQIELWLSWPWKWETQCSRVPAAE